MKPEAQYEKTPPFGKPFSLGQHEATHSEVQRKRFFEVRCHIIVPDEKSLGDQAERIAIDGFVYPEDFLAQSHFSRIPEMVAVSGSEMLRRVNSEGAIKVSNCPCIGVVNGMQVSRTLEIDAFNRRKLLASKVDPIIPRVPYEFREFAPLR